MLYPGLVSVTFRKLTPGQIVDLVREAGLTGIEWGGDIHTPHGDLEKAAEVRRRTEDAGLQVCAYGSYYRSVDSEADGLTFEPVLASALALGAPVIRVWPGRRGSADADAVYRESVAANLREIGETASRSGVLVALEFHGNTLTDTVDSALALMGEVDHPNVKLYWQAPHDQSTEVRLDGLKRVRPHLSHLHAFYWDMVEGNLVRSPLSAGTGPWRIYLDAVADLEGDRFVLLEFVRDDSPQQFLEDARTLKRLIDEF